MNKFGFINITLIIVLQTLNAGQRAQSCLITMNFTQVIKIAMYKCILHSLLLDICIMHSFTFLERIQIQMNVTNSIM